MDRAHSHSAVSETEDPVLTQAPRLDVQWVFGYGSLMWNPEFEYSEKVLARVHGFHRAFCIRSTLYRGTPENPGVVLGLDHGGCVDGIAFRIRPGHHAQAIERLYAREMVQNIYRDRMITARLRDGRKVQALAFIANREHEGYVALNEQQIVARLLGCKGARGPNCEYAINTFRSLEALGVHDAHLAKLVASCV